MGNTRERKRIKKNKATLRSTDMKDLSSERSEILKEYGFCDKPDCKLAAGFPQKAYTLDTKMLVQGSHATDLACVYYSHVCSPDGEELCGLFYYSSLLEYLLTDFAGEWDPYRMLDGIQEQLECKLRLVSVEGYPYLYIEIGESALSVSGIRYKVSGMLKLIGQLDYLLPREKALLLAKRQDG